MINKDELEFYILTTPPIQYDKKDNKELLLHLTGDVEVIKDEQSIFKGALEKAVIIYNSII